MSENKENKRNEFTAKILQVGTAECAIFFAVLAMVLALLFLSLGFWKTVLIAVLVCLGLFIGGVKNKKQWLAEKINKLFPPRQNVPYRAGKGDSELERAVKAATEKKNAEPAGQEPQEHTEE